MIRDVTPGKRRVFVTLTAAAYDDFEGRETGQG
jgi:hypothetical protein